MDRGGAALVTGLNVRSKLLKGLKVSLLLLIAANDLVLASRLVLLKVRLKLKIVPMSDLDGGESEGRELRSVLDDRLTRLNRPVRLLLLGRSRLVLMSIDRWVASSLTFVAVRANEWLGRSLGGVVRPRTEVAGLAVSGAVMVPEVPVIAVSEDPGGVDGVRLGRTRCGDGVGATGLLVKKLLILVCRELPRRRLEVSLKKLLILVVGKLGPAPGVGLSLKVERVVVATGLGLRPLLLKIGNLLVDLLEDLLKVKSRLKVLLNRSVTLLDLALVGVGVDIFARKRLVNLSLTLVASGLLEVLVKEEELRKLLLLYTLLSLRLLFLNRPVRSPSLLVLIRGLTLGRRRSLKVLLGGSILPTLRPLKMVLNLSLLGTSALALASRLS